MSRLQQARRALPAGGVHGAGQSAWRCLAMAAALAAAAGQAVATTVTFTGGFTSFSGPVASASGNLAAAVHTEVNGQTVFADQPLPGGQFGFDNYGIGLKNPMDLRDATHQPVSTVDFSRVFFSGPVPNPNQVALTLVDSVDVSRGDAFIVGTIRLTNGSWFGNSAGSNFFPPTDFGLTITTHSSDPALDGHTFSDRLRFVVTNPAGSSYSLQDDADYVYFVNHPELGTLSVYERTDAQGEPSPGNVGSISFKMRIGSLLPVAFENPSANAFIGPPPAVPEPATAALWAAGVLALGAWRRRGRATSTATARCRPAAR